MHAKLQGHHLRPTTVHSICSSGVRFFIFVRQEPNFSVDRMQHKEATFRSTILDGLTREPSDKETRCKACLQSRGS